jgi:hypothetical protein
MAALVEGSHQPSPLLRCGKSTGFYVDGSFTRLRLIPVEAQ